MYPWLLNMSCNIICIAINTIQYHHCLIYTGLHAIRTLFYLIKKNTFIWHTPKLVAMPYLGHWTPENTKCARSVHHCPIRQNTVISQLERNHPKETRQCVKISPVSHKSIRKKSHKSVLCSMHITLLSRTKNHSNHRKCEFRLPAFYDMAELIPLVSCGLWIYASIIWIPFWLKKTIHGTILSRLPMQNKVE